MSDETPGDGRDARRLCSQCGPGYCIGDDGCRHAAPVPDVPETGAKPYADGPRCICRGVANGRPYRTSLGESLATIARVEAMIRLLGPAEMTPTARRQLRAALDPTTEAYRPCAGCDSIGDSCRAARCPAVTP